MVKPGSSELKPKLGDVSVVLPVGPSIVVSGAMVSPSRAKVATASIARGDGVDALAVGGAADAAGAVETVNSAYSVLLRLDVAERAGGRVAIEDGHARRR